MFIRKLLFALTAAVALFSPASAADLYTKAPAYLTYPTGNGFFWGLSASGLGGTTSSTGGLPSGNLIGGKFGLDFGYTGTLGTGGFWFVEHNFNAQALQGSGAGLSLSAAFGMEQRFAVGASQAVVAQFASLLPGLSGVAMPSVPTLPNITFSPANYYVFAATFEDDVSAKLGTATGKSWLFSYGAGVGALFRASNGWLVDTSVEWKHSDTGLLVGASPVGSIQPFADAVLGTVRLKF